MDPTNALPAAFTALFAGSILLFLLFLTFAVSYFVFWLLGLIHCIKYKHDKDRLLWVLLIIMLPFGFLLYYTMGRVRVPPSLPTQEPLSAQPTINYSPDPLRAPLDISAMQDEKKRAAAINEALSAMGKSGRR